MSQLRNTHGVILVTTLIACFVMVILAGVAISLMTTQARLAEHRIRRIKGVYASEAAKVMVDEQFRRGLPISATVDIPWRVDPATMTTLDSKTIGVTVAERIFDPGGQNFRINVINASLDYGP